ncbi:hypothetical protein BT96DRAFT_952222, partial [Gymnopus androsaceus JB14]
CIRAQASEAEAESAELKEGREAIISQIDLLNNQENVVVASIHGVPMEILGSIFQWCCTDQWGNGKDVGVDEDDVFPRGDVGRLSRIVLTSVCVAWCRVAHGTPELWRTLHLDLKRRDLTPAFPSGFQAGMIGAYLSHSGALSLSLQIRLDVRSTSTEVIEGILPLCPRIRSLKLAGRLISFIPLFRASSSLPKLEEIFLAIDPLHELHTTSRALFPRKIETLLGSSRLKNFTLVEENDYSLVNDLMLPSSTQLEKLIINCAQACFNPIIYLDIIAASSVSLVHLCILLPFEVEVDNSDASFAIHLPVLKTLDLTCFFDFTYDEDILRVITAPRLEVLDISRGAEDLENISSLMRELKLFQQRSHCVQLRSLDLYGLFLGEADHPGHPNPFRSVSTCGIHRQFLLDTDALLH